MSNYQRCWTGEDEPRQPDYVAETCIDCGKVFYRAKGRRKHRCYACKKRLMVDNITQLHEHSGPHYEHWRRAMKAAAKRL